MRFRLIPATIITGMVFFTVKLVDVVRGTEMLSDSMIAQVSAQQAPEATPKKEIPATAEKPAEAKPEEKKPDAKKPDEKKPEEKKPEEAKPEEKPSDDKKEAKKQDKKDGENPHVSSSPGETVDHRFTTAETELLQNLAKRRDELDHWERNVQIKEVALDAAEKRVDEKIARIEAMKQEVTTLLAQYNQQEDAKIRSLVKIYESMKPKDAARIFDEVEMPVLLLVIDRMAEKKAAPILAEMDSRKAKQITIELAAQRRMSNTKPALEPAAPPPAASPAPPATP